jgi:cobalt-zinc-cadmium efflux system outer membrane protein
MRRRFLYPWLAALGAALVAGCAAPSCYRLSDRSCVSQELACRFGEPLGPAACPRSVVYPHGISLTEELSEEQAVLVALWNNALFLEQLADLGVAQGDLVQAGLLPNPEVVYYFEVPHKPLKYLVDFPLEALWLRPIRVAAAEREVGRVCSRLTQLGLDLMRDTRQAYADLQLAQARRVVALDAAALRNGIARVASSRAEAGDISPQEASTAHVDAYRAQQDITRIEFESHLAAERLRYLMGVSNDPTPLRVMPVQRLVLPRLDREALVVEATLSRPDAQAAAQNAAAAAERLRLAKIGWVRFLGLLDATSGTKTGHEFGPAFRVTLPIFNQNQGGIARAEAELERADRQRQTVHNQIILDVRQSHLRLAQTNAELEVLEQRVRPEVDLAIRRTDRAYREGNTPYVVVLQTAQQLIDSRFREVQLYTDLSRAWADLERSVGRHLADVALAMEALPPTTPQFPPDRNESEP